ncbi:MAG TPA: carboxylesterase family protein [Solirubrobacteraceae bacterium]|nr:carboxylesterase family protein [Solirubrobacteraceae bacterium]
MPRADPAPEITLGHGGAVRGQGQDELVRYLGIPYAAAPFGPHRLRAPRPAPAWTGVRAATAMGPTAPKGAYPAAVQHLLPELEIPGEECLNLNVWAPADGAALPVLVWVHGGAFVNGSGSLPEYDGSAFARDGIVCVTLNYRLGAEGFLHLPDTEANRGVRDVIAALAWVRDEIARFGGDPGRVTIAGESAGAMLIATLLATPAAEGLFTRAIMHSGAAAATASAAQAEQVTARLAALAGRPGTRAALAQLSPAELVTLTGQTSASALAGDGDPLRAALAPRRRPFSPVIDGDLVPRSPLQASREGAGAEIEVLLCTTRDEGQLFLAPTGVLQRIDDALLTDAAEQLYGLSAAGLSAYRGNRPAATPGRILSAIWGDHSFWIPALALAGARVQARAPTWLARFDAVREADNDGLGSCHASDVPFAFGTIDLPQLAPRIGAHPSRAASDALHGTWVAFAAGQDPGWAPYDFERRPTALFTDTITVVEDPAAEERQAWPDALQQ